MKRIVIITATLVLGLFGAYIYLTWDSGRPLMVKPSHAFWRPRYCYYVTRPLANMGCANAQYKMGLLNLYGWGVTPPHEDQEMAVYWFEKAVANGHEDAVEELKVARHPEDFPQHFL